MCCAAKRSRWGIHEEGEIKRGHLLTAQSRILMKPPTSSDDPWASCPFLAWASQPAGSLHSVNTSLL